MPALGAGELYLYELFGAAAVDTEGRQLGVIESIVDNRGQDLLVLRTPAGDERMLPLADDTLIRFEREARRAVLRLPLGLWEA